MRDLTPCFPGKDSSRANELVHAYNVKGDILNFMQDGGKDAIALIFQTAGRMTGPMGAVAGGAIGDLISGMPAVQGMRMQMPAVNAPTPRRDGVVNWGTKMGAFDTAKNMVNFSLHSMNNVIYSLGSRLYSGQWGR